MTIQHVTELDEATHTYRLNGAIVPGVSEVLKGLGLIDARYFTEWTRTRGKAVHLAVRYYLEGDLYWPSVDSRIRGFAEGAVLFLQDAKCVPRFFEKPIGSAVYLFAGQPDCIGEAFGFDAVVDWKSGSLGETTGLQTAGYDIADGWPPGRRRIGVQLLPDGRYHKRDYDDPKDHRRFLSALDLYKTFIWKGAIRATAAA